MTMFLAACVVAVALASIVAQVILSRRVLDEFSTAEEEHRRERAAIMRALIARSPNELAQLDRAAGQAEARVGTLEPRDPRRIMSEQEYLDRLRADQEAGLGGVAPGMPEGM